MATAERGRRPRGSPGSGDASGSVNENLFFNFVPESLEGRVSDAVGEATFDVTIPILLGLGGGVTTGREEGSPICDLYQPPFPFTGSLDAVTVQVGREHLTTDPEAEMRVAMAGQ